MWMPMHPNFNNVARWSIQVLRLDASPRVTVRPVSGVRPPCILNCVEFDSNRLRTVNGDDITEVVERRDYV